MSQSTSKPPQGQLLSFTQARVDVLLGLLKTHISVLILTHDNPDTDALASAFALAYLFKQKLKIESDIAYGGYIGRAENRTMIHALHIRLLHASRVSFKKYSAIILVGTQRGARNHSLPLNQIPLVVIDHHPKHNENEGVPFVDTGGDYISTATKVFEYLKKADVKMATEIATALFCGIKSDAKSLNKESHPLDFLAYTYLLQYADCALVYDIDHPQRPREYFKAMSKGFKNARVFNEVVCVDLTDVYTPDLCAEISERLLQAEGIHWSIVFGVHAEHLYVSLRTRDKRAHAGQILMDIIQNQGLAVGRESEANACVSLLGVSRSTKRKTIDQIKTLCLRGLNVSQNTKEEGFYD